VNKIPWLGIHHVHFYVEDAVFWRKWFEFCLDFQPIASSTNQVQTEILQHGTVQIRLSSPINKNNAVTKYLEHHPPGIAEVVFAIAPDQVNYKHTDETELIPAWGNIAHKFVRNLQINDIDSRRFPKLFTGIDHLVVNVPVGQMAVAAQWYQTQMGLVAGDRFEIQTDHSALSSVVMRSDDHKIQIPINEPSTTNSQIQEFLDYNRGVGIQHLALHTHDIVSAIAILKQRGVQFLETEPDILIEYQDQRSRALLQIFTKPIFHQPTFFLEIIQRQNQAQGFGAGNFKSLFEAIEREQMLRLIN
jgi:4-hydroxyphenylpyruvate dioxygenase